MCFCAFLVCRNLLLTVFFISDGTKERHNLSRVQSDKKGSIHNANLLTLILYQT